MKIIARGCAFVACLLASCTSIPAPELARAKAEGVPVLFEYAEPCAAANSSTGCEDQFVVVSDRPIKYVRAWWSPINTVGDATDGRCLDCGGSVPHGSVSTGPYAKGEVVSGRSMARWAGPIACFRLERCEVEFMDGGKQEFAGTDVRRLLASTFRQCPRP